MNILVLLATAGMLQQPDSLLSLAAARGRDFAQLNPLPGARTFPAAQQQYRMALGLIDSSRWEDAVLRLDAVARIDARNPAYKGDLGYVQARLGRWDEAAAAFEQATQLQSRNPWYFVGLGIARAGQQRWLEAGGMLALAAATDSAVISRPFIEAILSYYERASRTAAMLEWYRHGTQRYPDVALWWLKLAQALHGTTDTAAGFAAVTRYSQLAPNEPLGLVTYATYLFDRGQVDSALVLAQRVAADTAYRAFAAGIFYNAGVRALQAGDYRKASDVLRLAVASATDSVLRARSTYYLGFADFNRSIMMLQGAEQAQDCEAARAGDSIATLAETALRVSVRLDSVNVSRTLNESMPQVRQGAQNMIRAYCPAGQPRRRP
jgi:Flp pilus assembly protein TadD